MEGEEKGAIRKYEKRKPYPPTLSEKRFLDRCSQLGNIVRDTVSVISCNPPCKDCIAPFTTVPLKALSDQV